MLRVSLLIMLWTYEERWFKISRGRLPRGFLERLILLRGFDSANVTPKNSPVDFSLLYSLAFGMSISAALAKVSRYSTRSLRSG